MKHLFIINPAAGQRENTQKLEEKIRALKVDWEIVYTTKEGDATRFARNAAETGELVRIYGCGSGCYQRNFKYHYCTYRGVEKINEYTVCSLRTSSPICATAMDLPKTLEPWS